MKLLKGKRKINILPIIIRVSMNDLDSEMNDLGSEMNMNEYI